MQKVSVAIATYNRVNMVREAIYAALDQTFKPFEIIVFDDNSPDQTFEILSKEFQYHDIVKIFKQETNTGGVPNWNSAVEKCSGEFVAWCSDDDRWFKWHLEKSILYLNQNISVGLVHSAFYESYEIDQVTYKSIDSSLFEKVVAPVKRSDSPILINNSNIMNYYLKYFNWPFHPSTFVFRKSIWDVVGPFDKKYEVADSDWFINVAKFFNISYLPHIGVLNRRHKFNWSNKMGGVRMQYEQHKIVMSYFDFSEKTIQNYFLRMRWNIFFFILLLRIFISRSRAGSKSSALDAMELLKEISFFKIFPSFFYKFLARGGFFSINFFQKVIFPNSEKYNKLGVESPD